MLAVNRQLVMDSPDLLDDIEKEAKATVELCKRCKLLTQLRKYADWSRFDWALMVGLANPVDEPFVKLMISLAKHGYEYNAISFHRWWRRVKSVNQQHLISYFTYVGFKEPGHVSWMDVYRKCCHTADIFKQMADVYTDDRAVELNLRALLGISQQTDIKQAWLKWAKENHPDKGGSVDKFVLVKAAYEEWQNADH